MPCSMAKKRMLPSGAVVKNLPANAGDTGDSGLIPGLGRSSGGGNGLPFPSVFLPGKSPWTEKPSGLQSVEPLRVRHD